MSMGEKKEKCKRCKKVILCYNTFQLSCRFYCWNILINFCVTFFICLFLLS